MFIYFFETSINWQKFTGFLSSAKCFTLCHTIWLYLQIFPSKLTEYRSILYISFIGANLNFIYLNILLKCLRFMIMTPMFSVYTGNFWDEAKQLKFKWENFQVITEFYNCTTFLNEDGKNYCCLWMMMRGNSWKIRTFFGSCKYVGNLLG